MKKLLFLLLILNFSCNNEKSLKKYYSNGNLKLKITLNKKGIPNGKFEQYFENGKLKDSGKYINGIITDSVYSYYENGQIKEKGVFHNGHKQNWWKVFDKNNKILKKEEYYEVNDSAYLNQNIQFDSNGKINYSKSTFFNFKIPDTLKLGKNLINNNEYYTYEKGSGNYHYVSIIIDNEYSKNKIKKDTFLNKIIKSGKNNPWFGIYAYKKGRMKIKGKIEETFLITKQNSKDSEEIKIFIENKYFEKEVFIIDK